MAKYAWLVIVVGAVICAISCFVLAEQCDQIATSVHRVFTLVHAKRARVLVDDYQQETIRSTVAGAVFALGGATFFFALWYASTTSGYSMVGRILLGIAAGLAAFGAVPHVMATKAMEDTVSIGVREGKTKNEKYVVAHQQQAHTQLSSGLWTAGFRVLAISQIFLLLGTFFGPRFGRYRLDPPTAAMELPVVLVQGLAVLGIMASLFYGLFTALGCWQIGLTFQLFADVQVTPEEPVIKANLADAVWFLHLGAYALLAWAMVLGTIAIFISSHGVPIDEDDAQPGKRRR